MPSEDVKILNILVTNYLQGFWWPAFLLGEQVTNRSPEFGAFWKELTMQQQ